MARKIPAVERLFFIGRRAGGNVLSNRGRLCFYRRVFPLLSIACFMGGTFIVLTRVLLLGVAALTAETKRGAGKD